MTAWIVLCAHLRELFLLPDGDVCMLWATLSVGIKDLALHVSGIFVLSRPLIIFSSIGNIPSKT